MRREKEEERKGGELKKGDKSGEQERRGAWRRGKRGKRQK